MCATFTIGITGGIGSGKSIISRILRCNGFFVYDCDSEAKYLMTRDKELKQSLQMRLGGDIYFSNGTLNKKELAKIIFSNIEKREYVNSIVHAAVRKDIVEKRKKVRGLFFIESAILATGGITEFCNSIWIVTASPQERIKRISKRDNLSLKEISQRIESQEEELDKIKSEKIIILENDNQYPILPVILTLVNRIKEKQIYKISC